MTQPLPERNRAVVNAYRQGASLTELAASHGCSPSNIYRIVSAAGVTLTREQRRDRIAASNRSFTQRPEYRERKRQQAREWWGS